MISLFGTDGVRGIANTELTPELAFNLGRAGAHVLTRNKKHSANIIVGVDTRVSCDMLESALVAGICSVGAHAVLVGIIPTPGIAHLIREYNMDAGIMISASHNPVADNGIKFFNSDGYKLPDVLENEIENIIVGGLENLPRPVGENLGTKKIKDDALEDYIKFLKSTVKVDLEDLNIAIDCANGATYKSAPLVLSSLGAKVLPIHNTPNGVNINKNCGSTHMQDLVEYVKSNKLDIGIAYDGDGDRCLVVDENGYVLDGDEIMSICGNYLKEQNLLKNNTIVATVMSNLGFFMMGKDKGIKIKKVDVGDRYVLESMLEGDFNFGGEQSGHIIFLDHNTTGDGILTSLQLLEIMKSTGKKLSELNVQMKVMPQVLVNAKVSNAKKHSYSLNDEINEEINNLERKFEGRGRVLIRPSGTEPLIRVMIEGEDEQVIRQEANKMVNLLEKLLKN